MERLYERVLKCFDKKENFVMVTVEESSGSAPGKPGARMLVCSQGICAGTVGGGSVEYQALLTALEVLETQKPVTKIFDLGNSEASELGMVCGGRVMISFCFVRGTDPQAKEKIQAEYEAYLEGRPVVYIFGAGHVSRAVVPVLASVGFQCIVADDRPEFADPVFFPMAEQVYLIDFKNIGEKIEIREKDYVIIMTRGHEHDYEVQAQALTRKPFYIGIMGSRHKIAFVTKRLLEDGFSLEEIRSCHMPVGLDIKAETPQEIAVSIAGELIELRAEGRADR